MKCASVGLLLLCTLVFEDAVRGQELKPDPGNQIECSAAYKLNGDAEPTEIRFMLFVPDDYDEKESFPLMLFLHGAGERGDSLGLVTKWGPPKIAEADSDFPFVLISPQCPEQQRWNPVLLARLVDDIAGKLKIDKTRMYCTGLSMGGYGTWAMLSNYPNLFAAAVPICGGGDPKTVEKFKHVPVWAFHGDADETVPADQSRRMVEAIKAAGGSVKYTEYEGVGHNSWSPTYSNQDVFRWLLEHQRQPAD